MVMVGLTSAVAEAQGKSKSRGRTFSQRQHNRSHHAAPRHGSRAGVRQQHGRSWSVTPRYRGSSGRSQGRRVSPRQRSHSSAARHHRFVPPIHRHGNGLLRHGTTLSLPRGLYNNDIRIRPLIVPHAPLQHHRQHHRYDHHRRRTILVVNPYMLHCPYAYHGRHCHQHHLCPYDQHGIHCGSYYHPPAPPFCRSY